MQWITNIWTARVLVIAGFLFGWNSLGATMRHMGNELFLLVAESPNGPAHSWHHFFRELGAPSVAAEINHLLMAVPALLGCFLAWPSFRAAPHLRRPA
jgi:hypothetical protein